MKRGNVAMLLLHRLTTWNTASGSLATSTGTELAAMRGMLTPLAVRRPEAPMRGLAGDPSMEWIQTGRRAFSCCVCRDQIRVPADASQNGGSAAKRCSPAARDDL